MRRLMLAAILVLVPLATSLTTEAQVAGKMWRIGFLAIGFRPVSGSDPYFDAFLRGLRDLGYVEGRNVVLEIRYAEGRNERFPALAAELVNLTVDVLVAQSTPAAIAAKQASSTVPVVMVVVGDPLGAKLIDSLAHPGGNVSGLSLLAPELSAKRLDLFKQTLPVLVLGERHLRRTLTRYFAYYHEARTHLSLDKNAPDGRSVERPERGRVISIREVGRLHHRYVRRAA